MEFSIDQYRKKLSEAVFNARVLARLSRRQLAEKAGVSESTIEKLENNRFKNLTLTTLQVICSALDITVKMTLSGKGAGHDTDR